MKKYFSLHFVQCNPQHDVNVQILIKATIQTFSITYIFINGFKKVYFIVMFDIVSSSKTTVGKIETTLNSFLGRIKQQAQVTHQK